MAKNSSEATAVVANAGQGLARIDMDSGPKHGCVKALTCWRGAFSTQEAGLDGGFWPKLRSALVRKLSIEQCS
jgi:hypothetical protein